MKAVFRQRLRRLFIILNLLIVVLYLLVCLVPFLDPGKFWFIALLGLGFPFLFITLVIFLIILLFLRSRWFILSIIALLISWQQLSVLFAVHSPKKFSVDKPAGTLRLLSWNVSRWDERNKEKRGGTSFRGKMMELIQAQNADILCFQEFFECHDPKYFESNIPVFQKMGYGYHYFFPSSQLFNGSFQYGLIIFSRYPVIDSAQFINSAGTHSEGFCYVDIKIQNEVIRVFTADLESAAFNKEDYEGLKKIESPITIIKKLKRGYQLRSPQAANIKKYIQGSPYPVIMCVDLDDVPNSYAYFTLKNNLKDAFLKKGAGIGRTLRIISPTLRLDYIFADKRFKVKQFTRLKVPYSDHYALVTDLEYSN